MAGAYGGADPQARPEWRWDVAFSFAAAQRSYVEQVAQVLKVRGVRCFYDADEQIELWGKYLAEELPAIYAEQAAAVVVFVSTEYAARDWTRLERRAALARAVRERREFVLPARFDDTPLPGVLSDMATVDLRTRTPQQFAAMIIGKLAALGIVAPSTPVNDDSVARDAWAERPTGGTPADFAPVETEETARLRAAEAGQENRTARGTVPWTAAFTRELSESLIAFPDMHEYAFRRLVLRDVGERLGYPGNFPVENHNDFRDHIRTIIYSCKDCGYPAEAVAALVAAIRELRPGARELDRLEDCEASIKGLSTLGAPRLHSVLHAAAPLSLTLDRVSIHELAHGVATAGETLPLRGREYLPEVIRRLDAAQETVPEAVPLVVRFLAALAAAAEGDDKLRLSAEVARITGELRLSADAVQEASSAARAGASHHKILQIRVDEISPPSRTLYTIDGAVFVVTPSGRQRIAWWRSDGQWPADEIDEGGKQFLAQAKGLGRTVGATDSLIVEFLLPWSLLGHPVERWRIDDDDYWIGYLFPVVVRSLDRQRKELFFRHWRRRWDFLFSADSGRPLRERVAWLHYGDAAVPVYASSANRIIPFTGKGELTRWLEGMENKNTAGLGLTFAYQPDDPIGLKSVTDAVREGIPLILWRRDGGDAGELELLLQDVSIHDLLDKIHSWRRMIAGDGSLSGDARYNVVLVWDDPNDVIPPSGQFFRTP
jgi:vWA-MoxR associated protein C-terminal domain/TIR domain/Effector-associated domain 2